MTSSTQNGAISVVIHGATGRMGSETVRAVSASDDIALVGRDLPHATGRCAAHSSGRRAFVNEPG